MNTLQLHQLELFFHTMDNKDTNIDINNITVPIRIIPNLAVLITNILPNNKIMIGSIAGKSIAHHLRSLLIICKCKI